MFGWTLNRKPKAELPPASGEVKMVVDPDLSQIILAKVRVFDNRFELSITDDAGRELAYHQNVDMEGTRRLARRQAIRAAKHEQ